MSLMTLSRAAAAAARPSLALSAAPSRQLCAATCASARPSSRIAGLARPLASLSAPRGETASAAAFARRSPPARWASSTRAAAFGAPHGQITSALQDSMRSKIMAALKTDLVEVVDASGDCRHVEIRVVSDAFEGKRAVARQRLVYKAIWEELQDVVHAVDGMWLKTREEAGFAKQEGEEKKSE